ncbi:unnamed protein product, partial [Symbiodinium sp. CCMP2592]
TNDIWRSVAELYQELAVAIGRAVESAEEAARAPDPGQGAASASWAEPASTFNSSGRATEEREAKVSGCRRRSKGTSFAAGAVLPKAPNPLRRRNLRAAATTVTGAVQAATPALPWPSQPSSSATTAAIPQVFDQSNRATAALPLPPANPPLEATTAQDPGRTKTTAKEEPSQQDGTKTPEQYEEEHFQKLVEAKAKKNQAKNAKEADQQPKKQTKRPAAAMSSRQSSAAQGTHCDSQVAKGAAKDAQGCAKDANGRQAWREYIEAQEKKKAMAKRLSKSMACQKPVPPTTSERCLPDHVQWGICLADGAAHKDQDVIDHYTKYNELKLTTDEEALPQWSPSRPCTALAVGGFDACGSIHRYVQLWSLPGAWKGGRLPDVFSTKMVTKQQASVVIPAASCPQAMVHQGMYGATTTASLLAAAENAIQSFQEANFGVPLMKK